MNLKSISGVLVILARCLILPAQTPSIAVLVSPAKVCPGDTVFVTIETSDTFDSGNSFVVLLSDSSGSFANADTLNVVQAQSDTTIAFVPDSLPGSTHYQIAVNGSDPGVTGIPVNLTIRTLLAPPNTHLTYNTPYICTGDSIKLKIDSLPHVTYTWFFKDTARANSHPYYFTAKKQGEYGILFNDTSAAGCSIGFDSVYISIHIYPLKPSVASSGPPNICGTGTVHLIIHDNDTAVLSYQWTDHGDSIAGATGNTYGASATGAYSLVVSTHYGCTAAASDSVSVHIANVPSVSLQLAEDSFCLYGPTAQLSGGQPSSGYFSGNFVDGNQFVQTQAGLGNFIIYYTVVDSIGCHSTDSATISILNCTTGIEETGAAPAIDIFPNPVSEMVAISTNEAGPVKFRMLNTVGQVIAEEIFESALHFPVENIPAGVYILQISNEDGNWQVVKKLAVQR